MKGGAFVAVQAAASSRPSFRVPFECGETWSGQTRGNHSPANAIDFNHYPDDYGWKVTASAAGTVATVRYLGNRSYGRYIELSHGGGWSTLYAHLSSATVKVGQKVKIGQLIGRVGNTGGSTGPHLHYEQKHSGYPQRASFNNGAGYYWGNKNYKVGCKGGSTPPPAQSYPYSISKICGSSYRQIDSHAISGGKVVLAYSSSTGKNCVATMKSGHFSTKTSMSTFVRTKAKNSSDSGKFGYYAGPAKLAAKGTCVQWGGTIAGKSWTSKYGHCG